MGLPVNKTKSIRTECGWSSWSVHRSLSPWFWFRFWGSPLSRSLTYLLFPLHLHQWNAVPSCSLTLFCTLTPLFLEPALSSPFPVCSAPQISHLSSAFMMFLSTRLAYCRMFALVTLALPWSSKLIILILLCALWRRFLSLLLVVDFTPGLSGSLWGPLSCFHWAYRWWWGSCRQGF